MPKNCIYLHGTLNFSGNEMLKKIIVPILCFLNKKRQVFIIWKHLPHSTEIVSLLL